MWRRSLGAGSILSTAYVERSLVSWSVTEQVARVPIGWQSGWALRFGYSKLKARDVRLISGSAPVILPRKKCWLAVMVRWGQFRICMGRMFASTGPIEQVVGSHKWALWSLLGLAFVAQFVSSGLNWAHVPSFIIFHGSPCSIYRSIVVHLEPSQYQSNGSKLRYRGYPGPHNLLMGRSYSLFSHRFRPMCFFDVKVKVSNGTRTRLRSWLALDSPVGRMWFS